MAQQNSLNRRGFLGHSAMGLGAGVTAGSLMHPAAAEAVAAAPRLPREVWIATISQNNLSADTYQDMTGKKTHAVGISLEGATRIDDRSFVHVFHNSYAHKYGRYDAKQDAWMNYHWVVFRADGATAKVTISDWADQKQPGGPIGQGITFNFAQVHPYFEPEGK